MEQLGSEKIQAIRELGLEAERFLGGPLYAEVKTVIAKSKEDLINRLFRDIRMDNETRLTREQFVERLSAEYETLGAEISIIQGFVERMKQLDKMLEAHGPDTGSSQG